MRLTHIITRFFRTIWGIVLAVVLLAVGIVITVYSEWGQTRIKNSLLAKLNSIPGMELTINDFRLRFPLNLDVTGVKMIQDGDTLLRADTLMARVKLLPILRSKVEVGSLKLINGYYKMGAPDSAMYMVISADALHIEPASINLSDMDISLDDGYMRGALIDMRINPDTTAVDTTSSAVDMKIRIKHLSLDETTFSMKMLPTIDSLVADIHSGAINSGLIDLKAQQVKMHSFIADSLDAAYIAADSATVALYERLYPAPQVEEPSSTPPWTVMIDTIRLERSTGLYTTRGVEPLPGLDFGYIQASDMSMTITDFYNQATTLRMPMVLHATERCGLTLDASGTFAMDSAAMRFEDFNVNTDRTHIYADGMMGVGDLMTDPALPLALNVNGYAGVSDLITMFPDFKPYLVLLPATGRADLTLNLNGTPSRLNLDALSLAVPSMVTLKAKGALQNIFSETDLGADLTLSGHIFNVNNIVKAFTTPDLGLIVPPMGLNGNVHMHHNDLQGKLQATTLGGDIALDARVNTVAEGYSLDLKTHEFPVQAFMPDLGVGKATVQIKAVGNGFDVFNPKTKLDASADIVSLVYEGYDYQDISFKADIHDGLAHVNGGTDNEDITLKLDATCNISGDSYNWDASLIGDVPDLMTLKLSETPLTLNAQLTSTGSYNVKANEIDASLHLPELYYKGEENNEFTISDIDAKFFANDSTINLALHNRDLNATATSPVGLTQLSVSIDSVMAIVDSQLKLHRVDVDTIQRALPRFAIDLTAGADNFINDILAPQDMNIGHLAINAANDSSLYLNSSLLNFASGSMTLDTIGVKLTQDGNKMHIVGNIDNRKGNMDDFAHVRADGLLNTDRLSLRIIQQNASNETGFDLGLITMLADSVVTARFFPLSPTIGYKKWTVNLDNFIRYNLLTHNIDANLKMKGDDSSVSLHTEKMAKNDSINNIVLNISDIHLADWIAFNPFAPPISGNLSATMNLLWDGATNINGNGKVTLDDFFYDNRKVSAMEIALDVETNLSGTIRAQADFMVDGERTMTLAGILNDTESDTPFSLDFSVIKFPLATVNPFLPEDMAQLSGTLNGLMKVSGDANNPLINGEINFEKAFIKMAMTNTAYALSDVKIPVVNNIVTLSDFNISGTNDNPLYINGVVDVTSMSSPKWDLNLKAKNMMVVNTQRPSRNATIYGKAYMSLDAKVKGNLRYMAVNADVDVLSGTNVSYVLTESTSDLTALTNDNLVKFVNLNDTAAVAAADSISSESMLMQIDAQLNIQTGTTITVDLPTGSRDKVQLQPSGYLTYTQAPLSDGRLTGRINVNNGFARYTLPVIGSEKKFTFNSDSYIAFNGDILNPVLNIKATDVVKANVTQEGQNSRLVNFDIGLSVTGTLEQMDVAFDLSTDDDLTVANELQSMTAEQRANQAMNMLLYNMYTGPGTTASGNLTANPLFSFLESQINNWAANNIKGVDLSFGIDQYNQTTNGNTTNTMNYSYQVSKTLFNDRFKVVVGGNYSTDNNADENIAENLINDISFEYYLNKQQTMLIRLFRHVGYASILEGEITQTGVGFVYRKRLDRLANMLPKFMRPKYNPGL